LSCCGFSGNPISFPAGHLCCLLCKYNFYFYYVDLKNELSLIHSKIDDSTPAILIVIIMFILPANLDFLRIFQFRGEKKQAMLEQKRSAAPSLIDWPTVQRKLPWGLVLMLGTFLLFVIML